jgi:hypothetical protein
VWREQIERRVGDRSDRGATAFPQLLCSGQQFLLFVFNFLGIGESRHPIQRAIDVGGLRLPGLPPNSSLGQDLEPLLDDFFLHLEVAQ